MSGPRQLPKAPVDQSPDPPIAQLVLDNTTSDASSSVHALRDSLAEIDRWCHAVQAEHRLWRTATDDYAARVHGEYHGRSIDSRADVCMDLEEQAMFEVLERKMGKLRPTNLATQELLQSHVTGVVAVRSALTFCGTSITIASVVLDKIDAVQVALDRLGSAYMEAIGHTFGWWTKGSLEIK